MKKLKLNLLRLISSLALASLVCCPVYSDTTKPAPASSNLSKVNTLSTKSAPATSGTASTAPNSQTPPVKAATTSPTGTAPVATSAPAPASNTPATTTAPASKTPVTAAATSPAPGAVTVNPQQGFSGKIIDAKTKKPVEGAILTLGDQVVHTGPDGTYSLKGPGNWLLLRSPGYAAQKFDLTKPQNVKEIALTPFKVKALYLTVYGVSSTKLREDAIKVLKRNGMNALVIDVKGDRGFIPFKVDIPLAKEIGAQDTILIKDMPAMMAYLKGQGLYLIARIVTFKDDKLAGAKPEWMVRKGKGAFKDREHLRWVDPFREEVWNYNIEIAKAAAALGFDEVQFDYVRAPDTKGVIFSKESNRENRTAAITGFLTLAHKALASTGVMVAADIFGYVPWNTDDTGIGQEIDKAVNAVDIVSPMLYPSGFQFGIPDYRNPVQHPYEIVYLSLKKAQERAHASPLRFRPWLQAFRDYAFHGGFFSEPRMRTQIKAANDFGASGYMFWNPGNKYPTGRFDS